MEEYNVFLSHNSKDKSVVEQIATALQKCGLKVWLDGWVIRPGASFQESIASGLQQSKAVAVFIGPDSLGQWEDPELQIAISRRVTQKIPVMAVLLPGVPDDFINKLPPFLTIYQWIDFRNGVNDPKALYKLRWGITMEKPPEPIESAPSPVESGEKPPERRVVDDAVANLIQSLKTQNVTYFLGPGASYNNPSVAICHTEEDFRNGNS